MSQENRLELVLEMNSDAAERIRHVEQGIREDGRYPLEAFDFLHKGLQYTTNLLCAENDSEAVGPRHVSGQELCRGLRDLATRFWGPLARLVLSDWNIDRTRDFGEMVFLLIRLEFMGAQPSDRIEDFDDVFDFSSVFGDYEIDLRSDADDDEEEDEEESELNSSERE